jgi:CheY-like chemotaxis protein
VAATGKPYICADTGKDPLYVFGLESCGSSLTVPLRLFDKTLGVFNVESDKTSGFTEHDRQFAEIFGRYVAMALYILNLLLVERYTTSKKATGNVQGELSEPLNDLTVDAEALKDQTMDPAVLRQVERVLKDVDALKKRVKSVAAGPSTLLGADDAIESSDIDPALRGKRLLVVDNEPEVSGIIRDVLARRGMEVTVCDDGASAVKLMLQWQVTQDPDQGYDVIVSDINLGDATGYDVFAAAKAASVSVPVILMTGFGYDPHHSIVRASQEGLQCVLFKPFQAEKLIEEVKKALTGPGGPAIM